MSALQQTRLALLAYWQARAPRERLFLLALALFVLLALLANGLWHAHQARQQLQQQLPQLRLQLATMQQQAADIRSLQSQPIKPPLADAALRQTAELLLQQAGLPLNSVQLQTAGSQQLRLQAHLPFAGWLEAVALLQREARLQLLQARMEATAQPGEVQVDALFALPGSN